MQEEIEKYNYIPDNKKQKKYTAVNILLIALIVILIAVIVLFSTVFTTVTVDGESMYPTLVNNDKLFLQVYGYKLTYGDIVVFTRKNSEGKTINAVKRIIALGGDTISFDCESFKWIVNGSPLDEPYFDGTYSDNYFDTLYDKDALYGEGITIPDDFLFVLGDNRNIKKDSDSTQSPISVDSHIYGPIPTDSIVGKVISVY